MSEKVSSKQLRFPLVIGFLHDPDKKKYFKKVLNYIDFFGVPGQAFGVELPSFSPENREWLSVFGDTLFGRIALYAHEKGLKVVPLRSQEMHEKLQVALKKNFLHHAYLGRKDSMEMLNTLKFYSQRGLKFGLIVLGVEHARFVAKRFPSIYVSATTPIDRFSMALPRLTTLFYSKWKNFFEGVGNKKTKFFEKRRIKRIRRFADRMSAGMNRKHRKKPI